MAAGTALRISDTLKGGTTVVLLHGYLESLEIWGDFMKELAMHYRVLAIDIPGMGISQVRGEVHTMEFLADVLKGVLDKQGVERCFVVGHSMGGYVAEAFAAKYASMLQGLVLFHSTPNPDTEEKRENRRREIELVRADKKELIAELFAPKGFAPENRKRLRAVIEQLSELISMSDSDGGGGRPERIDPAGRSERNAAKSERAATLHLRSGRRIYSRGGRRGDCRRTAPGRNRMARPFGPYGICRGAGTGVGNPDRVYRPVPVKQCCGWFCGGLDVGISRIPELYSLLGHGVIAAAAPRMTGQQPLDTEITPFEQAVFA